MHCCDLMGRWCLQLDGREMFVREDREPPGDRQRDQKEAPAGTAGTAPASGNMKRGRRERGERAERGGGEAAAVDAVPVGRRLYVNNLSYDTTWTSLKDHFRSAGNVLYADVLTVGVRQPWRGRSSVLCLPCMARTCSWDLAGPSCRWHPGCTMTWACKRAQASFHMVADSLAPSGWREVERLRHRGV